MKLRSHHVTGFNALAASQKRRPTKTECIADACQKGELDRAEQALGWLDRDAPMMEALLAFKRAGADGILTDFALDAAERLVG